MIHTSIILKITLLATMLSTMLSCSPKVEETSEPVLNNENIQFTQAQFDLAAIEIGSISKQQIRRTIVCRGTIDVPPNHRISLHPPARGFVHSFDLIPGQRIRKGERLLVLSHPDYLALQGDFLSAKNELIYLQKEFERQKTLADQQATAAKNLEQITSQMHVLEAQKSALAAHLTLLGIDVNSITPASLTSEIAIFSPVNGFVTDVNITLGMMVNMEDAMLALLNREHLHAELAVFERDLPGLKENQQVMISVPNLPNSQALKGYVKNIGQHVDESSKTVNVHAHLEEDTEFLKIGMAITAEIMLDPDTIFAVPAAALSKGHDQSFLFEALGNGSFRPLAVQTGVEKNGYVEILNANDVPPEAKFVVKGAYYLAASLTEEEQP